MTDYNIKTCVVGVDISNECTTYAVVDVRGNIIAKDSFKTSDYPDASQFAAQLTESILLLTEANGGFETIRSIGISSPSANFVTGCIENAANLSWKGIVPLSAMLRDSLGVAVAVANDAHTTAIGEKIYGLAHGMQDFIVINIGVGLGSCFYSSGREHQGYGGYAGELGHICMADHGRKCSCGQEGCLESYCSARGIVQTARELMSESDEPSLMRDAGELSPRVITDFCEQGDRLAIETYRRTGYMLGMGLAIYAMLVNPEAIILTGGVSHAGHWLMDSAEESFENHVFRNLKGKVKLLLSRLDDRERDVLGASALAWDVPEYSLFK